MCESAASDDLLEDDRLGGDKVELGDRALVLDGLVNELRDVCGECIGEDHRAAVVVVGLIDLFVVAVAGFGVALRLGVELVVGGRAERRADASESGVLDSRDVGAEITRIKSVRVAEKGWESNQREGLTDQSAKRRRCRMQG